MTRQITRKQMVTPAMREKARALRKAMTPTETRLWQTLRRNGLDRLYFRRQQVIGAYIVDFCCLDAGVVVEVDGPIHQHTTEYDAYRDTYLASHNLLILRFTNAQVTDDLQDVLERISAICRQRLQQQSCEQNP